MTQQQRRRAHASQNAGSAESTAPTAAAKSLRTHRLRHPLRQLWRRFAQWAAVTLSLYTFPGSICLTFVMIWCAVLLGVWGAFEVSGVAVMLATLTGISVHGLHELLSVALDTALFNFGELFLLGRGAETVAYIQHAVDPNHGDKRTFFLIAAAVYTVSVALYFAHVATDTRWKRAGVGRTDVLRRMPWFAKCFRGYFPAELYADVATGKADRHLSFARLDGSAAAKETELAIQAALKTFPARREKASVCGESKSGKSEPAKYLICAHPHGLFSFSVWCTFNCWTSCFGQIFDARGFVTTIHTLAANFRFAIWREILLDFRFSDVAPTTLHHALGGIEATHIRTRMPSGAKGPRRSWIASKLSPRSSHQRSGSTAERLEEPIWKPTFSRPKVPKQARKAADAPRMSLLVPGGAEESVNCTEARLTLAKRKGFIRIALQTGASLVPMFTFGETELYRPVTKHPLVIRFLMKLEKVTGIGTPLVIGHDFVNIFTPRRRKLRTVFGKPIDVRAYWRAAPPPEVVVAAGEAATAEATGPFFTDEDVEALHGVYVRALEDLFARYQPRLDPDGPQTLSFDSV